MIDDEKVGRTEMMHVGKAMAGHVFCVKGKLFGFYFSALGIYNFDFTSSGFATSTIVLPVVSGISIDGFRKR